MKVCKFCGTQADDSAQHCTSCGSAKFLHVCGNCGTHFDSAFCPNCGVKAGQAKKTCPDCGTAYFTAACPNCGYTPGRKKPAEQTVIHQHIYEGPQARTAPTPTQARRVAQRRKGCGCLVWLLVLLVIAGFFGSRSSSRKSSSSARATNTPKVTSTAPAGPTATPEPAVAAAQEKVDAYLKAAGKGAAKVTVRRAAEPDRGRTGRSKEQPDYTGALGYAAVSADQRLEKDAAFADTPWQVPVYEKDKQFWNENGTLPHKTEVAVLAQELTPPRSRTSSARYTGYLQVLRLDTGEACWLDISNFVVSPYWEESLTAAQEKGYCIAVFFQRSDWYPVQSGGAKAELADGTPVLLPVKEKMFASSPDKKNNPVGGIVFTGAPGGKTVWFHESDLSLSY